MARLEAVRQDDGGALSLDLLLLLGRAVGVDVRTRVWLTAARRERSKGKARKHFSPAMLQDFRD